MHLEIIWTRTTPYFLLEIARFLKQNAKHVFPYLIFDCNQQFIGLDVHNVLYIRPNLSQRPKPIKDQKDLDHDNTNKDQKNIFYL